MKITSCSGCFDKLHAGHTFVLGVAYQTGGFIICGINSDKYIREHKGREPFRNEQERKDDLMATGIVSAVHVFEEDNPIEFIKAIKPNIHVIGIEYENNYAEKDICEELGIQVLFVPRIGEWSTSNGI